MWPLITWRYNKSHQCCSFVWWRACVLETSHTLQFFLNKCWCFWSFGVVDFTFKICFYLFFSRAPIWDRCAYCCLPCGLQALMSLITFKFLHRQLFHFIRPQYISPAAIGTNFVFPVPAFWTLKLTAPTDLYLMNYQGTWIHMKMLVCFIGWLTGV